MSETITKDGNFIVLGATDVGKYIRIVEPGNVIIRIDTFGPQLGDTIEIEHMSLATVGFDKNNGAHIRHMGRFYPEILETFGVVTLRCIGTNEWNLSGALRPKPEWQLDVDSFPNLSYGLNPVVNVDWATELAALEASLAAINSPGLPVISCSVYYE